MSLEQLREMPVREFLDWLQEEAITLHGPTKKLKKLWSVGVRDERTGATIISEGTQPLEAMWTALTATLDKRD